MESASVGSKGQVTIPLKIRQQLGIRKGTKVSFNLSGNHVELWVTTGGFGMLNSKRKAVAADIDVTSLLSKS